MYDSLKASPGNRIRIKNLPLQALKEPRVVLFLRCIHLLPRPSFEQVQHASCFRHQAYLHYLLAGPSYVRIM